MMPYAGNEFCETVCFEYKYSNARITNATQQKMQLFMQHMQIIKKQMPGGCVIRHRYWPKLGAKQV